MQSRKCQQCVKELLGGTEVIRFKRELPEEAVLKNLCGCGNRKIRIDCCNELTLRQFFFGA